MGSVALVNRSALRYIFGCGSLTVKRNPVCFDCDRHVFGLWARSNAIVNRRSNHCEDLPRARVHSGAIENWAEDPAKNQGLWLSLLRLFVSFERVCIRIFD